MAPQQYQRCPRCNHVLRDCTLCLGTTQIPVLLAVEYALRGGDALYPPEVAKLRRDYRLPTHRRRKRSRRYA